MHRRDLLFSATAFLPLALSPAAWLRAANGTVPLGEPQPFDPAMVRERAQALAAAPYEEPTNAIPPVLAELSYDQHRDIRFRPEMALWKGQPVDAEVQFFHLGHVFTNPVHIFAVADGAAREVLYTPELFDYGANELAPTFPETLGFAGFRLHMPLNRPDYLDEVAAFLGASYFRAVGRGQHYGISARGIAVNTALPSGEEFPWFREFWIEQPPEGAERLVVHALLDGPSLAGAYRFEIAPGEATRMDVTATLYPRRTIDLLGMAPLTSMFLFGSNDREGVYDFRPNVHDSEGLQIFTGGGDWLWRPLVNPERLRLSVFGDDNPRGFGLLQRDREFDSYQDLEARYDLRPSLWVEPLSKWGRGHIRLVEIPADAETHDNIVAFWVPEQEVEPGSAWELTYRLHWCTTPPVRPEAGRVAGTRVGLGGEPGRERDTELRKFVIDFIGGKLEHLPGDARVEAEITASKGEMMTPVVQKNEVTGGWRVFFDFRPEDDGPTELRAHLRFEEEVLTETWVYQWTP